MNEQATAILLQPRPVPVGLQEPGPKRAARGAIAVGWARHQDEVREAQRLRYQVFAGEMGARLSGWYDDHDIDAYDDYCEHLIVRDAESGRVIGTYRVLTAAQAQRVGSFYSDTEFDLVRLHRLRERWSNWVAPACIRSTATAA